MTDQDALDHFVGWAKAHASPIDLKKDIDDFRDLEPLKQIIGDARIVGFGESQHHIAEFNRFRSRLFRYLVNEMGFTTFVFETGVIEAKGAYDYVLGTHDSADDAFMSFEWIFGMWREIQDLLRWMRDYNRNAGSARKLRFYGMDGSHGWSCASTAVAFACDYLDRVDADYAQKVRDEVLPLAESIDLDNVAETTADALRELVCSLTALVGQFRIEQMQYIGRSTPEEFDWARQSSVIAQHIGTLLAKVQAAPENSLRSWWNMRDACKALQLKWIRDREGPNARLLVGAHNIHFQNAFARETEFDQTTMGQHLSVALPDGEMVMIAGTNNYGLKPDDPAVDGSFQAALAQVGLPSFILDLRSAADEEPVAAWLNEERTDRTNTMYQPQRAAKAWDVVFYSQHITLDTMSLPTPLARTFVTLDPDRLDGLVGVYDIDGVIGIPVVLCVTRDGDRLVTNGEESDGELFPMHESELFALSETRFSWSEWPMEVEFERDANGFARGLNIGVPGSTGKYHGDRHR